MMDLDNDSTRSIAQKFLSDLRRERLPAERLKLLSQFFAADAPYNVMQCRYGTVPVTIHQQMQIVEEAVKYVNGYFVIEEYADGESGEVPPKLRASYDTFVRHMGLATLRIGEADWEWIVNSKFLKQQKLLSLNPVLARWPLEWRYSDAAGQSYIVDDMMEFGEQLRQGDEFKLRARLPIALLVNASDRHVRRTALCVGLSEITLHVTEATRLPYLPKPQAIHLYDVLVGVSLPAGNRNGRIYPSEMLAMVMGLYGTFEVPTSMSVRLGASGLTQFFNS